MSDLFGAPSGTIAFHQDQDTQVATQERFAQMAHLGAMTEHEQMMTRAEGVKLQREQQMMQLLAKGPEQAGVDKEGNPTTPADKMMDLGSSLISGGFFKEGGDLVNKASEMKAREAQQKAAAVLAKYRLSQIEDKKLASLNNMLAASNDPQSFAAAKMVWLNENPGETIPPQLQEYNPTIIAALKKATKTGQEEAKAQQQQTNEAEKNAYRLASQAERRRHNEMLESHQKALEGYQAKSIAMREKTAGKTPAVGTARNVDVQAAQAMIMREFPDIPAEMPLGKEMVSSAAYDLASEAKALMARNRGLSMPEAMTQVYARMKQNGDFRITPKDPTFFEKITGKAGKKASSYKPASQEPAIPYNKDTKPEDGKIYDPGDGSKWRYDASKKKMVSVE